MRQRSPRPGARLARCAFRRCDRGKVLAGRPDSRHNRRRRDRAAVGHPAPHTLGDGRERRDACRGIRLRAAGTAILPPQTGGEAMKRLQRPREWLALLVGLAVGCILLTQPLERPRLPLPGFHARWALYYSPNSQTLVTAHVDTA